jgi:hypothetical protein
MLDDPRYITLVPGAVKLDSKAGSFATLYELTEYLVDSLKPLERNVVDTNPGSWAWLALFFFDQLCPASPSTGTREPRDSENYIWVKNNHRKQARHRLRTPYLLVRAHGDRVKCMFSKEPTTRGELTEQLTSRQAYLGYKGVVLAACQMYGDAEGNMKRGVAGRGPGCASRLMSVLAQLEMTYELGTITEDALVNLLPAEFDRFKKESVKTVTAKKKSVKKKPGKKRTSKKKSARNTRSKKKTSTTRKKRG